MMSASARRVLQMHQLTRQRSRCASSYRCSLSYQPCFNVTSVHPSDVARRVLSAGNASDGTSSSSAMDIIESTAATARWKRNHYSKIEDNFPPAAEEEDGHETATGNNSKFTTAAPSPLQADSTPLSIDKYEDVQPMWKQMESRVTKRRPLTADQRGGLSGRRNVRKSDEDLWLEAGVYNPGKPKNQ